MWRGVFKDGSEHRASIVQGVLEEHDIEAIILSKKDSPYGFGYLEVQVPADKVILALKVIEQHIRFE